MMLLWLLGCGPADPCEATCVLLVEECGLEAFPSTESCLQGCGYDRESGVDVEAQLTCYEEAACDAFATIACANETG